MHTLAALMLLATSGCETPTGLADQVIGPNYVAGNVFKSTLVLAPALRRVAVLPLTFEANQRDASAGREILEPILAEELGKAKRFELVWLRPDVVEQLTGKRHWRAEDPLPDGFLAAVREVSGCDAVLFCRLTQFHAYPPLLVGWNLKLVAASDGAILWAVDEVFAAADPLVVNAARRFQKGQPQANPLLADSRSILLSPRRFGHYTASAVIATLPHR